MYKLSVYRNSRYVQTPLIKTRDTNILAFRDRAKFDLSKATFYTFIQGDTVDGIAYRQYNNAQLGWAIMDANPLYQSEIEVKAGDVIKIPPYEEVVKLSE